MKFCIIIQNYIQNLSRDDITNDVTVYEAQTTCQLHVYAHLGLEPMCTMQYIIDSYTNLYLLLPIYLIPAYDIIIV